jgi:hypothetical protein
VHVDDFVIAVIPCSDLKAHRHLHVVAAHGVADERTIPL